MVPFARSALSSILATVRVRNNRTSIGVAIIYQSMKKEQIPLDVYKR